MQVTNDTTPHHTTPREHHENTHSTPREHHENTHSTAHLTHPSAQAHTCAFAKVWNTGYKEQCERMVRPCPPPPSSPPQPTIPPSPLLTPPPVHHHSHHQPPQPLPVYPVIGSVPTCSVVLCAVCAGVREIAVHCTLWTCVSCGLAPRGQVHHTHTPRPPSLPPSLIRVFLVLGNCWLVVGGTVLSKYNHTHTHTHAAVQHETPTHTHPSCVCVWVCARAREQVWSLQQQSRPIHTVQTIASVACVQWRPHHPLQIASAASLMDHSVHVWDVGKPFVPAASWTTHKDVATGAVV